MDTFPLWITVVSTLGGVLITAVASLVATYISKRSEERKHFQNLVVQIAISNWQEAAKHSNAMPPVPHYVVYAALMARLIDDPCLTPEKAKQSADRASRILDALTDNALAASRKDEPGQR